MKNLGLIIISIIFFAGLFGLSIGYAQQPNVTITGKTYNDYTAGVRIHSNLAKLGRTIDHELSIKPDSTFELKFYLPEPSEISFNNMSVLCTPGDSVNVVIRGTDYSPNMEFTGRGSSIYNFMNDLREMNWRIRVSNLINPVRWGQITPPEALKIRQQQYLRNSKLFESYVSKHHPPNETKAYAYSKIYFQYLTSVRSIIGYAGVQKDSLTAQYLDPLTPSILANDLYLHSGYYLNFMTFMIEEQWVAPSTDETAAQTMQRQFDFVDREFSGTIRDALTSLLLVSYMKGSDTSVAGGLEKIYRNTVFNNSSYNEAVAPFYQQYKALLADWSSDTTRLINVDGRSLTFADVIKENEGKILYVDLRASWCSPGRTEFTDSRILEERYADKEIEFLYFSIDDSPSAWRKAHLAESLPDNVSFLIDSESASQFKAKLNLIGIPRYLIFDKSGNLIVTEALGPSDPRLRQILDQLLEKQQT